ADPGAGAVVANNVIDTVTVTTANVTAGELPASGSSGHMVESGGNVLTFLLSYKAATDVGGLVALTQTASSGLASTASITRSVTATHYDQYGDAFPGGTVVFTSVNHMPTGISCTAGSGDICTTIAAHGLSAGDDFGIIDTGALRSTGSSPVIATSAVTGYTVLAAASTTTFTVAGDNAATVVFTTASTAADPAIITTTSFASASRTANSAGVATYSWADTESTSGVDIVTATPSAGTAASVKYYRLAAPSDVIEIGDGDVNRDEGSETNFGCVEFDAVGQDYIVVKMLDTDASDPIISYMQFTYDSNDHFGTAGGAAADL
ncbi:uncharacterized protein METZ01_LOCUS350402, partial [marine metagenome]